MIFLKILGAILLLLFLILIIPVRIRIVYDQSVRAYIPVLFFKIGLYPRRKRLKPMSKKKYEKLKKPKKESKKEQKKKKPAETKEKAKLSVSDIFGLIGEVTEAAGDILKKITNYLRVKIHALKIVISTDDAAKTAIAYGAVSGAAGSLMTMLGDKCRIKYPSRAETGVECDYLSGNCSFKCDILFSIFVWQLLVIALKGLKVFIKFKTKSEVKNNAGNKNK